MKSLAASSWCVIISSLLQISHTVRIVDSNSFRDNRASAVSDQRDHVESLAIFSSEPRYIDSSEIRPESPGSSDNPGPFFPIQFPAPIKYDQSNAIRYKTIDRSASDNTEQSTFSFGNIDIGDEAPDERATSKYISPLLGFNDVSEYRTPLISRTRDIEIYHQESSTASPYSGESIDIEMFEDPSSTSSRSDLDHSHLENSDNHPGQCDICGLVPCPQDSDITHVAQTFLCTQQLRL